MHGYTLTKLLHIQVFNFKIFSFEKSKYLVLKHILHKKFIKYLKKYLKITLHSHLENL